MSEISDISAARFKAARLANDTSVRDALAYAIQRIDAGLPVNHIVICMSIEAETDEDLSGEAWSYITAGSMGHFGSVGLLRTVESYFSERYGGEPVGLK